MEDALGRLHCPDADGCGFSLDPARCPQCEKEPDGAALGECELCGHRWRIGVCLRCKKPLQLTSLEEQAERLDIEPPPEPYWEELEDLAAAWYQLPKIEGVPLLSEEEVFLDRQKVTDEEERDTLRALWGVMTAARFEGYEDKEARRAAESRDGE